jgi:hypothetical protein
MMAEGEPEVRDHFSRDPRAYAAFRPHYPPELFLWLAGLVTRHDLAWDCATGNGQAAVGLAEHFLRVVATDSSAAQVSAAKPDPRIEYRVAPAHASGLAPDTVDLVTVAQALHWIEPESFYREARRVAAPGAAIAAWTYGSPEVEPGVDRVLQGFYRETVGPFWPAERRHVETGYADLPFPFEPIPAPEFAIEAGLTLPAMLGYVGTWSATRRYIETRGEDPVPALGQVLAPHWGPPDRVRAVRWPLSVLAARLD